MELISIGLLSIIIILSIVNKKYLASKIEAKENIDSILDARNELIIEVINSLENILRLNLKNNYDNVYQIICSTLQTQYENKDFDEKNATQIIEDTLDIYKKMLDYHNITLNKNNTLTTDYIVKNIVRIYKNHPDFCSRLLAVA